MGKLLEYIAEETQGACFTSFKYCYDTIATPTIEYGGTEKEYINLKEYAEDVHDPKPRDMRQRAAILMKGAPLFKYFWMVHVEYIKLTIFNMIRKFFQL